MSIKAFVHGFISGIGIATRDKDASRQHNSGLSTLDESDGRIAVIAITRSKQLCLTLKAIAYNQDWRLLLSESWAETFAAVEHRTTGVVLLDETQLGTDWRDALQMLLQPTHRCCVILIMSSGHQRFGEDFIQEGGFKTLPTPICEPEVVEVVRSAWDFWTNCIQRAYRYS